MTRLQKRQESTFIWAINSANYPLSIPQCGDIWFIISPRRPVLSIPPFSVIAYPLGGIPSVYPLALTAPTAPWTVVYRAGTSLLLGLVDSRGNSGGLSESVAVQSNGSTAACLPPAKTSSIMMAIDPLIGLSTCSTLPVQIGGGQKPYTVTFAPFGAASAINVTMGANDDTLEWVNTLPPDTSLLVVVSDSKGEYSVSRTFYTTGDTNTSCPNQTRSFNSSGQTGNGNNTGPAITTTTATNTTSNTNYSTTPAINGNNNNNSANNGVTFAIVGGAVGAVGAVLLLGLLFVLFRRRILGRGRSYKPAPDDFPTPTPFDHPATGTPMLQRYDPPTPSAHPSASSSTALSYYGNPPRSSNAPYLGTTGATSPQTNGYSDAPRQPANRAQNSAAPRGEESEIVGQNTNSAGRKAAEARQAGDVPVSRSMSNGARVFQGTGAGDIMEPPPAYGDLCNIPTHLISTPP